MGAGFVVLFGVVMVLTWIAMAASGLAPEDPPTTGYLAMNLAGSAIAAVLAGMVATSVGRSFLPPGILAAVLVILGAASRGQVAPGHPGWYPLTITVLGVAGIAIGAVLAPRPGRAAERV